MSSAICFNLDQSKILSSGNELNCVKELAGAFLVIRRIAAGWVVLIPNPIFFSRCK